MVVVNETILTFFEKMVIFSPFNVLEPRRMANFKRRIHPVRSQNGWNKIKRLKNHRFLKKNVKIVSITTTIRLIVDLLLDPKYMLKSQENKAPTPIFHVESIFDGFRTIGTRKMG